MKDLQEHIQRMLLDIKAARLASLVEVPVNPAYKIHRKLTHMDDDLGKVTRVVDPMVAGPVIEISVLEYEERINSLKMELFHASKVCWLLIMLIGD